MLTRCPHCQTIFRASPEQLAAHKGEVRCGACHHPFNAHTHLVEKDNDIFLFSWHENEAREETEDLHATSPAATSPTATATPAATHAKPSPASAPVSGRSNEKANKAADKDADDTPTLISALAPALASAPTPTPAPASTPTPAPNSAPALDPIDELLSATEERSSQLPRARTKSKKQEQTAEDIRQQGVKAGVVAARHRDELPGFSSWSAGALADNMRPRPDYALWPFVLTAVLFAFMLIAQVIYHFRGEINHHSPAFASFFWTVGIDVPLAREPERLAIVASELQTLDTPDRLRLFATLRNQAPYPLAWPHLEISLTDAYNATLLRKVFTPAEYLTRDQAAAYFPPGDTALKLDLGAREIAPPGYNLYLFYP